MNSRNDIHRTQQWQLAERQRYLSELEALGERVRADVGRLREEIEEPSAPTRCRQIRVSTRGSFFRWSIAMRS